MSPPITYFCPILLMCAKLILFNIIAERSLYFFSSITEQRTNIAKTCRVVVAVYDFHFAS